MSQVRVRAFANTFLIPNGKDQPTLQVVGPDETLQRKKRPHRKSRHGCVNCKKRKVKCDEALPCSNCIKRQQECCKSQPESAEEVRPIACASRTKPPVFSLPGDPVMPVNMLHMELLHHFEKVTIPTLSFEEIWPTIFHLAFQSQHSYLVNAMLSLAAAHLSYLVPTNPQYHRAGCSLLVEALADFRQALSLPIDESNCDALMGTSILIQHLTWADLSFVEGQSIGPEQLLDLSQDQLFLLSPGIRQIFVSSPQAPNMTAPITQSQLQFTAWPSFHTHRSIFTTVAVYKPCMVLEEILMAQGIESRRYSRLFMDLYDNPRYHGSREAPSPQSTPPRECSESPPPVSNYPDFFDTVASSSMPLNTDFFNPEYSMYMFECSDADTMRGLSLAQCYDLGDTMIRPLEPTYDDEARQAYERLAIRLSVVLSYLELQSTGVRCPFSGKVASGSHPSVPSADASLIARYIYSFPLLCNGPFLPMMLNGDSRALILLYHLYRAARILLSSDQQWWCRNRAAILEAMIADELKCRGLFTCMRDMHRWI